MIGRDIHIFAALGAGLETDVLQDPFQDGMQPTSADIFSAIIHFCPQFRRFSRTAASEKLRPRPSVSIKAEYCWSQRILPFI
jgi:hypothetical protein